MLFTMQRYEFFSKSQLKWLNVLQLIRCCLPCKGTNFLANHNGYTRRHPLGRDVVYHAKVRIFQQITTYGIGQRLSSGCCLPCKGTNFLANHNITTTGAAGITDVVYHAKVRIFQQITTVFRFLCPVLQMLFTMQRYEFFIKSQQFLKH